MKLLLTSLVMSSMALTGYGQTFTEIFKAAAFDRDSEDRLGYSVDISGDYAIIGAYGDDFGPVDPNMGSAYIFEKTGIEDWTFVQKINNSDQDDYDRFGWSVSINGNYAVIGAYAEDEDTTDSNTLSRAGSAYVFERGVDGVWTEMQKIVASDRIEDAEFGWSVDIEGTTLVVGAHQEGRDEVGGDFEYHAGAIYVFDLIAGEWTESQKIVPFDRSDDHVYPSGRPDPNDEDFSDLFGGSVAISGDYIVAGSHMHDYGSGGVGTGYSWNAGTAYVFERDAGVWTEANKLLPTIRNPYDRFGYDVDIDSNLIVIGVYAEDESEFEGASLMNAGGAYIFTRDLAGDWLQTQKLDASDRTAGDHFGISVAIDGDYLVIGAEQEDLFLGDGSPGDSLSNAGAAYIFEKDDSDVWSEIQKIVNADRDAEDRFGEGVAISETTIVSGAWQQDLDSVGVDYLEDAGAAYFYSAELCEEEFSEQDITICEGDVYEIGESSYSTSGVYIDTLLNIDACDSIVTTNLTMIETLFSTQDVAICSDESYSIGENTYTFTGTYVDTLSAALTGCDSVVTTELTVIEIVVTEQTIEICFGESYAIGDTIYTESGDYLDTLTSVITGCDSAVITNLTIKEEILIEQTLNICSGESVIVGESTYTEAGTYTDILTALDGCDSTVITTVGITTFIDISIDESSYPTLTSNETGPGAINYQWIDCATFTDIDGANEVNFTPTDNGSYAVIIEKDFCIDTSDCISIIDLGTTVLNNLDITIYPNPTSGQVTISVDSDLNDNVSYVITNNLGAIVSEGTINSSNTTLNLEAFADGIYLIRLTSGASTVIQKIHKQ